MPTKLLLLEQRLDDLGLLANEITGLVKKYANGENVQPELNVKGENWYRGARELLSREKYSGLTDFDQHWAGVIKDVVQGNRLLDRQTVGDLFEDEFRAARCLLGAVVEEIKSRELPVKSQLSFAVSADEFETALELLRASDNEDAIIRASGVVARVAIERHLLTVADTRSIPIQVNPPTKKKPEAQDVLNTLAKNNLITAIQKSELESLFKVGNNCAHPKESVTLRDVERMIKSGRELASLII